MNLCPILGNAMGGALKGIKSYGSGLSMKRRASGIVFGIIAAVLAIRATLSLMITMAG